MYSEDTDAPATHKTEIPVNIIHKSHPFIMNKFIAHSGVSTVPLKKMTQISDKFHEKIGSSVMVI